jgi:hypothetical protein
VTEDVVPWVLINYAREVFVYGDRIVGWDYDQFSSIPTLSEIGLAGGGGAA